MYFPEGIRTNGWNVTKLAGATASYNCHAYAWHVSEGGYNVWVDGWLDETNYSNPNQSPVNNPTNLEKYWTNNGGYVQKSTKIVYNKAFYGSKWVWSNYYYSWTNERDHSAVVSSDPNFFISKWGRLPRYKHKPNECPYESSAIVYYNINPIIQGSTSALCNSQTRTFSENSMSNISLNYQWLNSGYISTQSGGTGYNYNSVKANSSGSGFATVTLTVTSPSGGTASTTKTFWLGKPKLPSVNPSTGIEMTIWDDLKLGLTSTPGANSSSGQWSASGVLYPTYPEFTTGVECFFSADVPGTGIAKVTTSNVCGTSPIKYIYVLVQDNGGGGPLSIAPNPASYEINLTFDTQESITSENKISNDVEMHYLIRIVNNFGLVVYLEKMYDKNMKINISNWEKGAYHVSITNKDKSYSGTFIVN